MDRVRFSGYYGHGFHSLISSFSLAGCRFRLLAVFREFPFAGRTSSALLNQLGDQAGPSGLMTGAYAGSVIAVEVFVEQIRSLPMRIGLEFLVAAEDRPLRLRRAGRCGSAAVKVCSHIPQRFHLARAGRELHRKIVANNGGISEATRSAENSPETRSGPRQFELPPNSRSSIPPARSPRDDPLPFTLEHVRIVFVESRKRANAVRRKKFRFVEQASAQHLPSCSAVHHRQQPRVHFRLPSQSFRCARRTSGLVVEEPLHTPLETRQACDHLRLERLHRKQRNQSHHRTHLQIVLSPFGRCSTS